MKNTLLSTALMLSLCVPVFAEQDFSSSKNASDYPVFEEEDQGRANLGIFSSEKNGRISKNTLKPKITDVNDPDYVPPNKVGKAKKAQGPIPINMSGDHVEFENSTGDFSAVGKVTVRQGDDALMTNYAFGNMKSGDIYLLEGGVLLSPGNRTTGRWIHYNFNNKTGEMKQVSGRGLKDKYRAQHIVVLPDKVVADQGGDITRCFAKKHTPCMSVKAKTIEIYPNDKIVAHNVKVYAKGAHIYSRKLWINDFNKQNDTFLKPSAGWSGRNNGWYVKLETSEPISKKDKVSLNLIDYSRAGFKPMVELSHHERNWTLRYSNGWEEDDDNWYLKQNNWKFSYKPHHIIKGIPLKVSGKFEYGLWRMWNPDNGHTRFMSYPNGSGTESWHREFAYYINHDPIKLFGKNTTLHLLYGRKWVHESLNDENRTTNMYHATIRQKVTKQLDMWAGYIREKQTSSMFELDQPDMEREFRLGMQLRPTRNDVFSIVNRYDTGKSAQYKTVYNWYHRFCCWALQVSYEKKWYNDKRKTMVHYYLYNW